MTVGLGTTPGLLLTAVTVKVCPMSPMPSAMPVRDTVCSAVVFSRIGAGFMIASSVGGWLTGSTVTVKVCGTLNSWPPLAVPPWSSTVTVIVAVPVALGTVVKVSLPVEFG